MIDRRTARRCRHCDESMPSGAAMCAGCGRPTSRILTRLSDPARLRAPRLARDTIPRRRNDRHRAACSLPRVPFRAADDGAHRGHTHVVLALHAGAFPARVCYRSSSASTDKAGGYMDVCPRCGGALSKVPRVHYEGEVYASTHEYASYLLCVSCEIRVAWRQGTHNIDLKAAIHGEGGQRFSAPLERLSVLTRVKGSRRARPIDRVSVPMSRKWRKLTSFTRR